MKTTEYMTSKKIKITESEKHEIGTCFLWGNMFLLVGFFKFDVDSDTSTHAGV